MNESKITIRDIFKTFIRWQMACEMSNSYERMQAIAFCFAMAPVLKKLYPEKEAFSEALQRHLQFFNTEGMCGGVIVGLAAAMEEEKAATGELPGEAIVTIKTALMGPIAGIGDSFTWGTVAPIIVTFALTASTNGALTGWFLLLLFPIVSMAYSWYLTYMGYKLGRTAVIKMLESGWVNRIISGASMVGLFMIGALAASNVTLTLAGSFGSYGESVTFQSILDSIVPGLLPLCVVLGVYFYFKKSGQKFGRVILTIIVVSLILSFFGIV